MAAVNSGWRYLSPKQKRFHQAITCAGSQSVGGAPKGTARGHISRRVDSNICSGPAVARQACAVRLGHHMSPCRNSWQAVKHSPVQRVRTPSASVRHAAHTWPRRCHSAGRLLLALDSQWQVGAEVKPARPHSPILTDARPLCAKEHWNVQKDVVNPV